MPGKPVVNVIKIQCVSGCPVRQGCVHDAGTIRRADDSGVVCTTLFQDLGPCDVGTLIVDATQGHAHPIQQTMARGLAYIRVHIISRPIVGPFGEIARYFARVIGGCRALVCHGVTSKAFIVDGKQGRRCVIKIPLRLRKGITNCLLTDAAARKFGKSHSDVEAVRAEGDRGYKP